MEAKWFQHMPQHRVYLRPGAFVACHTPSLFFSVFVCVFWLKMHFAMPYMNIIGKASLIKLHLLSHDIIICHDDFYKNLCCWPIQSNTNYNSTISGLNLNWLGFDTIFLSVTITMLLLEVFLLLLLLPCHTVTWVYTWPKDKISKCCKKKKCKCTDIHTYTVCTLDCIRMWQPLENKQNRWTSTSVLSRNSINS